MEPNSRCVVKPGNLWDRFVIAGILFKNTVCLIIEAVNGPNHIIIRYPVEVSAIPEPKTRH